jgi:hypothetical protein
MTLSSLVPHLEERQLIDRSHGGNSTLLPATADADGKILKTGLR